MSVLLMLLASAMCQTVSFNGVTLPLDSIRSFRQTPDKVWELDLIDIGTLRGTEPPVFVRQPKPKEPTLTTEQEGMIIRELAIMVSAKSRDALTLRGDMEEKAESMAETLLHITKEELYKNTRTIFKIRDIVRWAMDDFRMTRKPTRPSRRDNCCIPIYIRW